MENQPPRGSAATVMEGEQLHFVLLVLMLLLLMLLPLVLLWCPQSMVSCSEQG